MKATVAKEKKGRVLVVDDEEAVCRAMRRLLRFHYQVEMVTAGAQVIEMLQRDSDFAAIVLDLVMPEVSGMQVFEWIKRNRPALIDHVVVCTGGVFDQAGEEFLEHWRGPMVEKPFDPDRLLAAVAQAVAAGDE